MKTDLKRPTFSVPVEVGTPRRGVQGALRCAAGRGADRGAALSLPKSAHRSGIALVITLLMLSVITFLAIAFLVMTRTNRAAVTTTLDQNTAKAASDAALNRAQAEIIAQMMAHQDILSYDYMASHNFISPFGFNPGDPIIPDTNNVNYDTNSAGGRMINDPTKPALLKAWVQNIANLYFDPRPPVFVQTNFNAYAPADFRFWVDLNRNGQFETNGYLLPQTNGIITSPIPSYFNGEPEWIGALQYPELPHSATNRFLMRYAYLVSPIGKTLDLNYLHNYAGGSQTTAMGWPDRFVRNQGVGSWELNLGAYLRDLNTNYYVGMASQAGAPYYYGMAYPAKQGNAGWCFQDAFSLATYRYNSNYSAGSIYTGYPQSRPRDLFGPIGVAFFANDYIDEYATAPSLIFLYPTNDPDAGLVTSTIRPWAGGNSTNKFYDLVHDLFDSARTAFSSTNAGRVRPGPLLAWAGIQNDSYDRYTYQRFLASMGTGSLPELQTYVYDPRITNLIYLPIGALITPNTIPTFSLTNINGVAMVTPPTVLRTKVNINYNNTIQITNNLNASPTNLAYWTQLGFFTNAADILLRSQEFVLTNEAVGFLTNTLQYIHFGVNRIPVYSSTNSSIRYSSHIHRMLQLAANIYDASVARSNTPAANGGTNVSPTGVYYPSVFRPIFQNVIEGVAPNIARNVYIIGFTTDVQNAATAQAQMLGLTANRPAWRDPSDPLIQPNDNVWGVPWVVGAVKGLPGFNQYAYATSLSLTRKLNFICPRPNTKPAYTNQFYLMSMSNMFAAEAWNSYAATFPDALGYAFSNCVSFGITNVYTGVPTWGTNFVFTNGIPRAGIAAGTWFGWPGATSGIGFTNFFQTNVISLPLAYFSTSANTFLNMSNYPSFLPADKAQKTFPVYPWVANITNRMYYALYDLPSAGGPPRLLDFVNIGPFGTSLNILSNIGVNMAGGAPPVSGAGGGGTVDSTCWLTAPSTVVPAMAQGVYNQMQIALGTMSTSDFPPNPTNSITFSNNLAGNSTNLSFDCPLTPSVILRQTYDLEAADPLVHYTVDDLTSPQSTLIVQELPATSYFTPLTLTNAPTYNGTPTQRYKQALNFANAGPPGWTFVDPGMTVRSQLRSDLWNFPNNKFPSIGWLGRVHRGTPWQTIFLKADADPTNNPGKWTTQWVTNMDNYPTNDYALLDLFTAAPNDNAASGLLSINQTNQAAWSALLSGVIAFTNVGGGLPIDPTNVPYFLDTNLISGVTPVYGINTLRALQRNGIFHHIGDILNSAPLTIASPFLAPSVISPLTDDVVERIPEQILGLVKVGQPQFVIYSWGQALRPKDLYLGAGPNFGLCTNYQITAEFLTRTVCHIVGDPFAANPKIQIDGKNILPAN